MNWTGLLTVTDVIDIVVTSILIYYLLLLIRGTRAVQILTGFLVIVGLLGLANLLHLMLLGTILQFALLGAAVTLPILFQPELRRALEQLGRGRLFVREYDRARDEDQMIAMIADAAVALSRRHAGALIVLAQSSGLKEFIETGTELNATLSADLLLALFAPYSPLHDGATIVRGGIIEAAGCVLPLAEPSLRQPRLGTRHRAALGLSEQTDAVVITVSEESGDISVARAGHFARQIENEAALARLLVGWTRVPRRRREAREVLAQLRAKFNRGGKNRADLSTELKA